MKDSGYVSLGLAGSGPTPVQDRREAVYPDRIRRNRLTYTSLR